MKEEIANESETKNSAIFICQKEKGWDTNLLWDDWDKFCKTDDRTKPVADLSATLHTGRTKSSDQFRSQLDRESEGDIPWWEAAVVSAKGVTGEATSE